MCDNILPFANLKISFENKGTINEQQILVDTVLKDFSQSLIRSEQSGLLHFYNDRKSEIYIGAIDNFLCSLPNNSIISHPKVEIYQFGKKLQLPEISLFYEIKMPSFFLKFGSLMTKNIETINLKLNKKITIEDLEINIYGNLFYLWTDNLNTKFDLTTLS